MVQSAYNLHRVSHRRSQGVHLHPQGEENNLGVIYRELKFVRAPPAHQVHIPRQSKSQFLGHFFAVRGRFGASTSTFRLKKVANFFEKKSAPRRQNPGYAYRYSSDFILQCRVDKRDRQP